MAKHKILVVDDEESLCEILQLNLEVEGYEVDVAYSAEQALGMHTERYALILLDVMMGEMSGCQNQVKVLSGLMTLSICGIKSPKKPPVNAPIKKVEMPHNPSSAKKL